MVEKVWHALVGNNSCIDEVVEGRDLLAVALGPTSFDMERELATKNLQEKTSQLDSVFKADNEDELANRISLDLLAICELEAQLPRMQWLQLLMTFLRFALPAWLLAQMQVTRLLHTWLLEAIDCRCMADTSIIQRGLEKRNRGLLHPTLTPTRELFEHIERYMKCRVEVNILLYCLEEVKKDEVSGKTLNLGRGGRGILGVDQLLALAVAASPDIRKTERFKNVADGLDIQTFLTREGEQFSAWRSPRMVGQGKNIDEFFRVLYRAESGDEAGGYLLVPEGRGAKRGFRVFPGQLLLKTVTYLAAKRKCLSQPLGRGWQACTAGRGRTFWAVRNRFFHCR